ncbi:putative microtubule-associated protein [[Mycoplasma] phocae]|uniref:Putative microtubule-associated protein n=1 Tax=[Mycoplasma] phocae TaxID=142651 RepID=A0A2Z5IRQ5_9BACT|nr:hypothetical protein [[Mycoplasma] phocae]AXE61076.1 putative microtubule-associated protein [[Mycoplasma] phocae]
MKKKNFKWWIALPVAITAVPLIAAACGNTSGKGMDEKITDPNKNGNSGQNEGGNGGNNNMTPPNPDNGNNQGNNNTLPKPNDEESQREKERLEKEKFEKLERKVQYLSLHELLYSSISDIAENMLNEIFDNQDAFKKIKTIDESKFILSKIKRDKSIQDFVELYNEELSKNESPENELIKMIFNNVANEKKNPIELGDNFVNEYTKFIAGNNPNFGKVILNLFFPETEEVSDNLIFFALLLLEYSNSNFSLSSDEKTNSEHYILLFKNYWETLVSLKNNDFYSYQYLYVLRRNLMNYNLKNSTKNPLFAQRKNEDISNHLKAIIDKVIEDKSSLTKEQVDQINGLLNAAKLN